MRPELVPQVAYRLIKLSNTIYVIKQLYRSLMGYNKGRIPCDATALLVRRSLGVTGQHCLRRLGPIVERGCIIFNV